VLFILLMQFLWKYIDDLAGKGLDLKTIGELLMYTSASLVPMSLPLAILLSSIMTFGNLGENYELIALKAAGISLQRIMAPLVFIIITLTISAFLFTNYVIPFSNLKMRSLIYDIQQQRPELQIKEGVFYNGIEGYSIKVGEKNYRTGLLRDLKIYDHTQGYGNTNLTLADSGYMKVTSDKRNLIVTLYNGCSYSDIINAPDGRRTSTYPFRRDHFSEQSVIIELSGFNLNRTDENLFKSQYQMLNLKQLKYFSDSISKDIDLNNRAFNKSLVSSNFFKAKRYKDEGMNKADTSAKKVDSLGNKSNFDSIYHLASKAIKVRAIQQAIIAARGTKTYISDNKDISKDVVRKLRKYEIEWHRKFALSFACFIFFFIGAPFGAIVRKGGFGMPVVASVVFFVFYYILSMTCEKFVREDVLMPYIGMWISSFIALPLGIFLTYKATTDSALLNTDTYLLILKRLPGIRNINKFINNLLK
jgi:lipopolysaccharide export system permease protein